MSVVRIVLYHHTGVVVTTITSRANVIKHFLYVIYGFLCLARMFVRKDLKSLPMTNTLAYYENP